MNMKPKLAHQRKRPRYKKKAHVSSGPKSGAAPQDTNADDFAEDESDTPDMESRTAEAEAAYQFAGQIEDPNPPSPESPPEPGTAVPAAETAEEAAGQAPDPQAQRREQERLRREQERERREQERREMQRRDQERRERERILELRSLNVDSICGKAWEIYSAEVKEEGVELFPDNDARELAKRSFRLSEIFLVEEARLRKLRSEPVPAEAPPAADAAPAAPEASAGE